MLRTQAQFRRKEGVEGSSQHLVFCSIKKYFLDAQYQEAYWRKFVEGTIISFKKWTNCPDRSSDDLIGGGVCCGGGDSQKVFLLYEICLPPPP